VSCQLVRLEREKDYWTYDYYCLFLFTKVVKRIIAREVGPAFSFSCLQEPVTGPCPDPYKSSLYPPVLFLWDIFYCSSPCMSTRWTTVFPSAFPTMSPTSNAFCMPYPSHRPLFGYPNAAIFGETPHNAYLFIRPFVTFQSHRTCSAKCNNEWSYTFAAPLCKHGMDRDNFSFTFYLYIMFILSYVTYIFSKTQFLYILSLCS
jgi:hypothetical protein